MPRFYAALFLIVATLVTGAVASARPLVALKLSASVVHRNADGSLKLTPATGVTLKTDDVVRYDIVATNTGDQPARGLRPMDDVPNGTAFVSRSASGPGAIEYSLDHGKTWAPVPTVVIHDQTGTHTVPADPATYTAVRWVTTSLKPGQSAHFAFDVVVK